MKITFILQDLFQQGAQYVTALMIRGFVAKGYYVDLIVSKVHTDLLEKGDIKPFEVPSSVHTIILKDRKARNNIGEIRKYLRTTDSRAVVAMSPNYSQALALASVGLKNKPKLAYVEHSGFVSSKKRSPKISPVFIYSRFISSRFDSIMAVSKGTARAIENKLQLSNDSVKVVYNPVVDDVYFQKLAKSPSHPWLLEKKIPTFVAAGAHCQLKNHLMIFEAIRLANMQTPVRLILFGKGELTNEYINWIKLNKMSDSINIANHTDNLPAEIKASDGFLIGSNVESFSIVLVEALAAGTPVISTDCPYGPPELLANGKYGTLVPINDAKAMANAIISQIKAIHKPAPTEAWEPFTLENVVIAYEKALKI